MRQSNSMNKFKRFCTATVFVSATIIISSIARADYIYTFNISSSSAFVGQTFGSFTSTAIVQPGSNATILSGSYTLLNDDLYRGNSITGSISAIGNASFAGSGGGNIFSFNGFGLTFYPGNAGFSFKGSDSQTLSTYGGTGIAGYGGPGLFEAVLSSSSGGGSGGGAGGAPTPEVNAGLGILIAGASFAFLRRKRGTGHEATAL